MAPEVPYKAMCACGHVRVHVRGGEGEERDGECRSCVQLRRRHNPEPGAYFFSSPWDHSRVAHLPAHGDSVSKELITWERFGSPQPWLWGAPLCLFTDPSESWCCCLYCRIPRSAVKKRAAVSLSVISFYCIWIVIRKKEMKPESRGWATE